MAIFYSFQQRFTVFFALFVFTACIGCAVASPNESHVIRVVDDLGETVTLPRPARRVIALSPHLTENVYAIGAGETLIGAVSFSNYPDAALKLPLVGDSIRLDLETILTLQPDLVLAWPGGNRLSQLQQIKLAGIPIFSSDPQTLEAIPDLLEKLGLLLGHHSKAQERAHAMREELQTLLPSQKPSHVKTVFYQLWDSPLMTLGKEGTGWISEAIYRCGGVEIFPHLQSAASLVSVEAVIAANPDIIFLSHGNNSLWKNWKIKAHLIPVSGGLLHRPTPRVIAGVREICLALR